MQLRGQQPRRFLRHREQEPRAYGSNGAVRIATPTTARLRPPRLPAPGPAAVPAAGRVCPGGIARGLFRTALSRASCSRDGRTTVLSTGCAAKCAPATARNAAGSSKNSRSVPRRCDSPILSAIHLLPPPPRCVFLRAEVRVLRGACSCGTAAAQFRGDESAPCGAPCEPPSGRPRIRNHPCGCVRPRVACMALSWKVSAPLGPWSREDPSVREPAKGGEAALPPPGGSSTIPARKSTRNDSELSKHRGRRVVPTPASLQAVGNRVKGGSPTRRWRE